MPVCRASTSNTILVGASRNCSETLPLLRAFKRGATVVGPRATIDFGGEVHGGRVARILIEHVAQDRVRRIVILALEILGRVGHHRGVAAIRLHAFDPRSARWSAGLDARARAGRSRLPHRAGRRRRCASPAEISFWTACLAPRRQIQLIRQVVRVVLDRRANLATPAS